jgi:hypothetical protein
VRGGLLLGKNKYISGLIVYLNIIFYSICGKTFNLLVGAHKSLKAVSIASIISIST